MNAPLTAPPPLPGSAASSAPPAAAPAPAPAPGPAAAPAPAPAGSDGKDGKEGDNWWGKMWDMGKDLLKGAGAVMMFLAMLVVAAISYVFTGKFAGFGAIWDKAKDTMGMGGGDERKPSEYQAPKPHALTTSAATLSAEEKISGTLSALTKPGDAAEIANVAGVKFLHNGSYQSAAGGHTEVITPESIQRVSIEQGGTTRYFTRIANSDGTDNKTGMVASAWVETDQQGGILKDSNGKFEVRMAFQGYTGNLQDQSPQTKALLEVAKGQLNPQTTDAVAFTRALLEGNATIAANGGKGNVSNLIYGSHSLGVSNALAAKVVSDLEGVKSTTSLAIEPVGAKRQLELIQKALRDQGSDLSKALKAIPGATDLGKEADRLTADIRDNVITLRTVKISPSTDRPGTQTFTGSLAAGIVVDNGMETAMNSVQSMMVNPNTPLLDVRRQNLVGGNAGIGTIVLQDVTGTAPKSGKYKDELQAAIAKGHELSGVLSAADAKPVYGVFSSDGKSVTAIPPVAPPPDASTPTKPGIAK